MEEPDLYDDILTGALTPPPVASVEALLELGVHRRVLRLPAAGCPLQAVQTAVARLVAADDGLRAVVGAGRLVFQRRSDKFDCWIDLEPAGERPVRDGERLRALVAPVLEAGEVVSSDDERRGGGDAKKRRRHRHGSASGDDGRRRRRHRRRSGSRKSGECRHRRHRHRRSPSSDGSRASSTRRRRGGSSRRSSSGRSSSSLDEFGRSRRRRRRSGSSSRSRSSRSRGSSSDVVICSPPNGQQKAAPTGGGGGPARPAAHGPGRSVTAWQHMDPEFAQELRKYEMDRAEREVRSAMPAGVVDVSDSELSVSSVSSQGRAGAGRSVTAAGQRVLDRLKQMRREADADTAAVKRTSSETAFGPSPEASAVSQARLYASYLNLDEKNPVMALYEYCKARHWSDPAFQITETPGDGKQKHFFRGAVRVNEKMYAMKQSMRNKKDAKRDAALLCLQTLGVLKNVSGSKEGTTSPP